MTNIPRSASSPAMAKNYYYDYYYYYRVTLITKRSPTVKPDGKICHRRRRKIVDGHGGHFQSSMTSLFLLLFICLTLTGQHQGVEGSSKTSGHSLDSITCGDYRWEGMVASEKFRKSLPSSNNNNNNNKDPPTSPSSSGSGHRPNSDTKMDGVYRNINVIFGSKCERSLSSAPEPEATKAREGFFQHLSTANVFMEASRCKVSMTDDDLKSLVGRISDALNSPPAEKLLKRHKLILIVDLEVGRRKLQSLYTKETNPNLILFGRSSAGTTSSNDHLKTGNINCTLNRSRGNLNEDSLRNFSKTSVLFVSVSFIILMVISLAWLVFYYVQRFRYAHAKDRLARRLFNAAKKALTKIPTRALRSGDKELDTDCPVCIEPYHQNDIIRTLPCKHVFHKTCVDPWLLEHRTCPMCKSDILKAVGFNLGHSSESVGGGGADGEDDSGADGGSSDGVGAGNGSSGAGGVSTGYASSFPYPVADSDIHDPFFPSPAASPSLVQQVVHEGNAGGFSIIPLTVHSGSVSRPGSSGIIAAGATVAGERTAASAVAAPSSTASALTSLPINNNNNNSSSSGHNKDLLNDQTKAVVGSQLVLRTSNNSLNDLESPDGERVGGVLSAEVHHPLGSSSSSSSSTSSNATASSTAASQLHHQHGETTSESDSSISGLTSRSSNNNHRNNAHRLSRGRGSVGPGGGIGGYGDSSSNNHRATKRSTNNEQQQRNNGGPSEFSSLSNPHPHSATGTVSAMNNRFSNSSEPLFRPRPTTSHQQQQQQLAAPSAQFLQQQHQHSNSNINNSNNHPSSTTSSTNSANQPHRSSFKQKHQDDSSSTSMNLPQHGKSACKYLPSSTTTTTTSSSTSVPTTSSSSSSPLWTMNSSNNNNNRSTATTSTDFIPSFSTTSPSPHHRQHRHHHQHRQQVVADVGGLGGGGGTANSCLPISASSAFTRTTPGASSLSSSSASSTAAAAAAVREKLQLQHKLSSPSTAAGRSSAATAAAGNRLGRNNSSCSLFNNVTTSVGGDVTTLVISPAKVLSTSTTAPASSHQSDRGGSIRLKNSSLADYSSRSSSSSRNNAYVSRSDSNPIFLQKQSSFIGGVNPPPPVQPQQHPLASTTARSQHFQPPPPVDSSLFSKTPSEAHPRKSDNSHHSSTAVANDEPESL